MRRIMGLITLAEMLVLKIPFDSLRVAILSFDHDGLIGSGGINLVSRERGYPLACLRSPEEHVRLLEHSGHVRPGGIVTQTYRNVFQNLRCPVYTRAKGICQSRAERVFESRRPYYGVGYLDSGRLVGMAVDFHREFPRDVRWFAAGIPILHDGEVLGADDFACEAADHSHIWSVDATGPRQSPEDVVIYRNMAAVFQKHLHSPADAANAALHQIAEKYGLETQADYLHNAVAVSDHELTILVVNTSLLRLGEMARSLGATHAVVVDNGGSCQCAVRPPGTERLVSLVQGANFRERTIALTTYVLASDVPWFSTDHKLLCSGM